MLMPNALHEYPEPAAAQHSMLHRFLSPEAFWFPERLVVSAWLEHAPFAFWLIATAKPGVIVELGTHYGFSYLAFCQAVQRLGLATRCHAVDSWSGDANTGAYTGEVLESLRAYHDPRYAGFSSLVQSDFANALPHFADRTIDLLHIDGQHDYDAVRRDFEMWRGKLSDRAVVLFHDVNVRQQGFGVARLWDELRLRYPGFAFQHGSGLGVLGVGSGLPETVAELIAAMARPEIAVAVSQAYSRLGAAVTAQNALADQSASVARLRASAAAAAQLRIGKELDAQQAAKLRAEVLSAKASEGRALAAAARVAKESVTLADENTRFRDQLAERDDALSAADDALSLARAEIAILRAPPNGRLSATLRRVAPAMSNRGGGLGPSARSNPYAGVLGRARLLRHRALLSASPLFDREWYLKTYPDVAGAKLDPVNHFLRHGAKERRDPGPDFDTATYLRRRPDVAVAGINPLVHFIRAGSAENQHAPAAAGIAASGGMEGRLKLSGMPLVPTIDEVVAKSFPDTQPFPVFTLAMADRPRVTMVTDSVNADSLYGGIGTGLVLSALLATRLGADLRLLTRTEVTDPDRVAQVLSSSGVDWNGDIGFACSPLGQQGRQVDVTAQDRFVTTSWWTTRAMLRSVGASRLVYLLQDDERMFYPHGDQRLRCAELLNEPGLRMVVNSRMLFDHLAATGVTGLARRASWFEPAFPSAAHGIQDRAEGRLNFFFYARPNHARNLYVRGIEAIGLAIEEGHLDPRRWTVHFIGGGGPVALPRGMQPVVIPAMPRAEYVALTRRMDAGLCLMYTPHPSYPPLDLAMAGSVVVTNRHEGKASMAGYSDNILCVEPDTASLAQAIGSATTLAADRPRRRANYQASRINRDWPTALDHVLGQLADL